MKRLLPLLLVLLVATPLAAARRRAVGSGPIDSPAAWLHHFAIPYDGDLAAFVEMVRDARVVALGDATHGTHELFASKQRLIPLLVAQGFRTIAFEAPYAEFAKIDEYLLHGTGDPAQLIESRRYWFWDTQEILELVRWARAENERGLTPPIRIAGIDATEPFTASQVVVRAVGAVDPQLAYAIEGNYACLGPGKYVPSSLCKQLVLEVRPQLEARAFSDEVLHAARVVEQAEEVVATDLLARDQMMAENALWLADRDGKLLIVGHNEHFGRLPYTLLDPQPIKSAGAYLAEAMSDDYFVLGSVLLEGTFFAVDYVNYVGSINVQTMTVPHPEDVALKFAQAGIDAMIVPLRRDLPEWLRGPQHMRIGASGVPSRERATLDLTVDLAHKYDAVLYIRRSTPSGVRHWPTFR
ncbi:MAG TPA: erythromycin esterase family protein [Thermoanaerobaculia bacterium]